MARSKVRDKAVVTASPKHKYALKFLPSALAEWQALDGSVKEPLRQLLRDRLDNPQRPGSALRGELRGYYKIKLLKQGYRLVYGVEDKFLIVMVMAVDKREDSVAYSSAIARLVEMTEERLKWALDAPEKTSEGIGIGGRPTLRR